MVHVEVDDEDALRAVLPLGMACGDGDIAQQAESFGTVGPGMMARRAYQGKTIGRLCGHDRVGYRQQTAYSPQRSFIAGA